MSDDPDRLLRQVRLARAAVENHRRDHALAAHRDAFGGRPEDDPGWPCDTCRELDARALVLNLTIADVEEALAGAGEWRVYGFVPGPCRDAWQVEAEKCPEMDPDEWCAALAKTREELIEHRLVHPRGHRDDLNDLHKRLDAISRCVTCAVLQGRMHALERVLCRVDALLASQPG